MGSVRAEIGVVDGGSVLLSIEAASQARIWPESRWAAMKLPLMAELHSEAPAHRPYAAPYAHICVAKFPQLAHLVAILPQAHDGKSAGIIRDAGSAEIEEPRSVRRLHDVVYVCRHADFLAHHERCFFDREARLLFFGNRECRDTQRKQHKAQSAQQHRNSFRGIEKS